MLLKLFFAALMLTVILVDAKALDDEKRNENYIKATQQITLQTHPEQIHLSYGARPDQMIVTWVTQDYVNESVVEYGIDTINQVTVGNQTIFTDWGVERRQMTIHRVLLENLTPGTTYRYHCGSTKLGWSPVFWFTTMSMDKDWSPRFAIFGDLGNINAQSLPRLQKETILGYYDAILHVGDFAYDLATNNARVGDEFMNQIEPIAAYLPYMTCVGNHEMEFNYSNYKNRFSMPNSDGKSIAGDNNFFYSINIGPIHLISFSTEFYYYLEYGILQVLNQYNWLENDLKTANLPENRALRPWIITMGHRPMYCTNSDQDDCTTIDDRVREGLPYIKKYGLETLFYKYGVDVELWAHEHSYERLWPLYNYTVLNGSQEAPYTNPRAPVHIITGSAGCQEYTDSFGPETYFSAFRTSDYGYTRMKAYNKTHLYFEQVSDDKDGKIIDSIWVIKDTHGSYS